MEDRTALDKIKELIDSGMTPYQATLAVITGEKGSMSDKMAKAVKNKKKKKK